MAALPEWFRQRRYLHFDEPLSRAKAEALVTNAAAVASHSFWPLVRFTVQTSKIKQDKATGDLTFKNKDRLISYAAHSDSQIFSFYCGQLTERYEAELTARGLSKAVLAFRSLGKSNIDFAKQAFDEIRSRSNCVVVALDVTRFFDSIKHAQLKCRWKALLGVPELPADHYTIFRALTRYAYVERDEVFAALGISPPD